MKIHKYTYTTLVIWVIILLSSCDRNAYWTKRVAAENWTELQKVLDHYSDDKEKQRAAEYLIYNMTLHVSYPVEPYKEYCREVDSLFKLTLTHEQLFSKIQNVYQKYASVLIPQYDARNIQAQYLINCIDSAFDLWKKGDFLTHIDFNLFCEYVLPYKCAEGQTFDDWKIDAFLSNIEELDCIRQTEIYRHSALRGYWAIHNYILKNNGEKTYPHPGYPPCLHPFSLLHAQYTDCYEKAYLELMYCRANGIPAAVDFVPNWADMSGSHAWLNIYMTSRRNEPFEALDPNHVYPGYFRECDFRLAKVYRQTYAPNKHLLNAVISGEELPNGMSSIFVKDVTSEYSRTIKYSSWIKSSSNYLYLAVFDNNSWVPVDISKNRLGFISFKNIGVGVTYCVVEYQDGIIKQVDAPFYVSLTGEVERFKIAATTHDIRLSRKYPSRYNISSIAELLQGGLLEASHSPYFDDYITLGECSSQGCVSGEIKIHARDEYQYYRIRANKGCVSEFAEIFFFSEDGYNLSPNVFDSSVKPETDLKNVCDGNVLTNFRLDEKKKHRWVGFDFGKPISLSRMVYVRRGDGNSIVPNHTYELYYNKDNTWILHDRVIAMGATIEFKDVPNGALLYIKNVTEGKENRIFIYDDNLHWR